MIFRPFPQENRLARPGPRRENFPRISSLLVRLARLLLVAGVGDRPAGVPAAHHRLGAGCTQVSWRRRESDHSTSGRLLLLLQVPPAAAAAVIILILLHV